MKFKKQIITILLAVFATGCEDQVEFSSLSKDPNLSRQMEEQIGEQLDEQIDQIGEDIGDNYADYTPDINEVLDELELEEVIDDSVEWDGDVNQVLLSFVGDEKNTLIVVDLTKGEAVTQEVSDQRVLNCYDTLDSGTLNQIKQEIAQTTFKQYSYMDGLARPNLVYSNPKGESYSIDLTEDKRSLYSGLVNSIEEASSHLIEQGNCQILIPMSE